MTRAFPVVDKLGFHTSLISTFPVLSPVIQVVVVDPSLPTIFNCLSPVAESASTLPMITFPDHVEILLPEAPPKQRFESPPPTVCPAERPKKVL